MSREGVVSAGSPYARVGELHPAMAAAIERGEAVRCGCCGLFHGRALQPGEHCDWCPGHGAVSAVQRPWHLVHGRLTTPTRRGRWATAGRAWDAFGTFSAWAFLVLGLLCTGFELGVALFSYSSGALAPGVWWTLAGAAGIAVLGGVLVAWPRVSSAVSR